METNKKLQFPIIGNNIVIDKKDETVLTTYHTAKHNYEELVAKLKTQAVEQNITEKMSLVLITKTGKIQKVVATYSVAHTADRTTATKEQLEKLKDLETQKNEIDKQIKEIEASLKKCVKGYSIR